MLSEEERQLIFKLAVELTGGAHSAGLRHEALLTNVQRRMRTTGQSTLVDYLKFANRHPTEQAHLISALSIHTTSWFRENPHFVAIQEHLLGALKNREVFRVWCAACASGEEVYSFGLLLEEFRAVHPGFDYEVIGTDIDPVSIETANRAVYPQKSINFHLSRYKHHLLDGTGPTEGLFTLSKAIRKRCSFQIADLRSANGPGHRPFHVVVCRNALIYFDQPAVELIVTNLVGQIRESGLLLLGHSETVEARAFGLIQKGHSVFERSAAAVHRRPSPQLRPELVLIGASTGGPQALVKILRELPKDSPPIVIAQHIYPTFSRALAEYLAESSGLSLGSPEDGTAIQPGHLYLSFGDYHIAVERAGHKLLLKRSLAPAVSGHRPSVDVLFQSGIGLKCSTIAILLTGMGRDGATGLHELRREGVFCVAQSEEDCVIYGMPRKAIDLNAADFIGNLDEIHRLLSTSIQLAGRRAA